MRIIIETIPHKDQRYDTAGDWYFDDAGSMVIKVSGLGDWRKEFLVAVHELIEVGLCSNCGITAEAVDKFDMNYKGEGEPGDAHDAPYRRQHFTATTIERQLADALCVDWLDYEKQLSEL